MNLRASIFAASLAAIGCAAVQPEAEEVTYIIPIRTQIDKALVYVIRRGVEQAQAKKASAVIFVMDTPGGRVDQTEEILRILQGISVPTYTFVEKDAFSAGAMIAMATDHIYMAPMSRIGAATPYVPDSGGGAAKLPESVEEKMSSATRAIIRSAAQEKGHDPELAEAMVDRRKEYKIGDKVINPAGQVLTLTNMEAEQLVGEGDARRPLLSRGTVKDVDELLIKIGRSQTRKINMPITSAERIAMFIESPVISALLLGLGILGVYIEIKTPGFGLPGILGTLSLLVFFWGHHVAGLAGWEELVVFMIGIALLVVEVFFIPGFGVVGVAGLALMMGALLSAMVQRYPGGAWYSVSLNSLQAAVLILAAAIVATSLAASLLGRFLPKTAFFHRLVLAPEPAVAGSSLAGAAEDILGTEGVAFTVLRPAGVALFGDVRRDVVARGEYIEEGARVRVVECEGNRIVVERVG